MTSRDELDMSFFFDVSCPDGFVLASERLLLKSINGAEQKAQCRKIRENPHYNANKTPCAVVVCGDFPEVVLRDFTHACAVGDTLRDIAKHFAERWTQRFQPEGDELCDSAVHLVGFEAIPNTDILVPQMWYWTTWIPENNRRRFYTRVELEDHLQSFTESSNPHNNHMCRIFAGENAPIPSTLEQEYKVVMDFFEERGPHATWNGDRDLWGSAFHAAQALKPVFALSQPSSLKHLAEITNLCLEFLVKISSLLPNPLLGLPPGEKPDILLLSKDGPEWYKPKGINWTFSSEP